MDGTNSNKNGNENETYQLNIWKIKFNNFQMQYSEEI